MNKILNKNIFKIISKQKYPINQWVNHWVTEWPTAPVGLHKRFAGHSKWQNIKHTKLSKDAEKSQIINKLLNKLKKSLKNSGGTDPKINREFGDVMEMCRRANISNTTIDKAINRALNKKSLPLKLEIMGPNGCLIVIDAEADSMSALRYSVKAVLKKYKEFAFVEEGRAMFAFEEKGVVRVRNTDEKGNTIGVESAEEIAIEADAEEVKECVEDESILLFITDVRNCFKTKTYIEEKTKLEVIESGIELMPYTRVDLPSESLQVVVNAIDELEALEEIVRVYNNVS